MMPWFRAPFLAKYYFPGMWNGAKDKVYLTFDDGPHATITPWVLSILAKHKIKATFFCVGENIKKNAAVFKEIQDQGHLVGNHTFEHLKGRKTNNRVYCESVEKTEKMTQTKLFRPPYGSIKKTQLTWLKKLGFTVVFWSWLSYDFNKKTTPKSILQASSRVKGGDILVFHDSAKAETNLKATLESIIEQLLSRGFSFDVLPIRNTP